MINHVFTIFAVLLLASHLEVVQRLLKMQIIGVEGGCGAEQEAPTKTIKTEKEENVCTCQDNATDCRKYFYLCRNSILGDLMEKRCKRTCRYC